MAPEQARGEAVDHRADLYTLGIILYEMLSGSSPFRHEEFVVVLTKKLTEDPPPLPEHVSSGTRDLVFALLRRSPDERPQSASEIVARIDSILGYSPSPSLAFAPVSGQGAALRKKESPASVAYANTVLGDVPASAPAVSWTARAQTAFGPALELARRPVALGQKQVPLGLIGAVLVALPLLLVLLFSGLSGSSSASSGSFASASAAAPADDDLTELMARAQDGDQAALAELLGKAARAKLAPAYLALGRGYFKIGQLDAGLRAYRSAGELDPKLGDSPDVLRDLRRGLGDPASEQLTLDVATALGSGGADFLYEVYDSHRTTNAPLSKQAKLLLDSDAVVAQQSEALRVALELAKAKTEGCPAVKKLLPRVTSSGDARSTPILTRLADRRGCGFLGLRDCFACLRAGKDFANAQKAVAERPAPKLGVN